MKRAARLASVLIILAALSIAPSAAAPQADQPGATPIDLGAPIERDLAIGGEHLYRLTVAAGEAATIIVEQRGIDVVVRARRADGESTVEFQEEVRRHGRERVDIVADSDGVYILAIAPSHGIYAGTYALHVASRRPATASDRAMYQARQLRTAAADLAKAARFDDARRLLERALAGSEAARGPDDVLVGMLLHDLVGAALETRDDARAEPLQRRALAIFEHTWGAGHPYAAMARLRLAVMLHNAGQRAEAEALLRPASELIASTLGTEHAWFAACLRAEASILYHARDLDRAEALYQRGMAILEKVGARETSAYTATLNNLGLIYRSRQDLGRAEAHYRRALALAEVLEGPESYHVSLYLQNLGHVARDRKEYANALAYATRALAIRRPLVGDEHIDTASLLTDVAVASRLNGDVAGAADKFFQALRIVEQSVGPYHRITLSAVGNIAQLYRDTGEVAKAIPFQRRADAILEKQLELNLAVGSERQKLTFVKGVSERTDRTISLHLLEAAGDADAGELAALVVLQRKGRVLDAMTDAWSAVRRRVDDEAGRALLDRLNSATARLAQVALNATDGAADSERRRAIAELEAEKERLEVELGTASAELRAQMQPVTLAAIQAALPADAALLEFAVFRPFDPGVDAAASYGPPHYAAYVVRKDVAPRGIDLGPVAAIDRSIEALRHAVRDRTRTDVRARARVVHDVLIRPLYLAPDVSRLLVSPDGGLNLVPFEALVDAQGRYLIERFSISYLSSGRDLLRMPMTRAPGGPPVIVADPAYGEPAPAPGRPAVTDPEWYFAPLANTAEEARAIKRLFPDAVLLTGPRATKAAVRRLEAPRLLHVAAHGFFLQHGAPSIDTGAAIENPLLRSGIALAGANRGRDVRGDGILTALEASGLNLWGTALVTLSACDTGVGEVRNGEGVYGLRRAFLLAGTATLVMSLWPVSDYVARETMVAYYSGLRAGLGRGEALRQAKLAMLKRKVRQHPFYWASFIQSGEWASLDGTR